VQRNRGVALILALLVLSFLTILGGALLTTSTIDVWISDNYKTYTQALYLAEAGVDSGRQMLSTSSRTPSQLLLVAAGPDGRISTSTDLAALLASDDQPLIPVDPALRSTGQPLIDDAGELAGYYYVWLRNDNADGMASISDTNQTLTLMSFGSTWGSKKAIETTVQKGAFPDNNGDPRLYTPAGLQGLVSSVTRNAMDVFSTATITDYGAPSNYRVALVNGNLNLGPGTGYGILLTRGNVNVTGNFVWNGLIVIVGAGALQLNGHSGTINGGLFAGGVYTVTDPAQIKLANQSFPYTPIAIQER
jgi:ABC-type transport system involved in multi-copper enzyme maturation permease subunit